MQEYDKIILEVKTFADAEENNNLSVEKLAQKVGYSTKQLTRIFIMTEGITPGEYLRWRRLSKELYEIKYSSQSILEIALKYGPNKHFTNLCLHKNPSPGYFVKAQCKTFIELQI